MVAGPFICQAVLWFFIPEGIRLQSIRASELKHHLKPVIVLFVPILAMQVYHIMDKTMLGIMSTYEQSGYYYNADKVINIPFSIIFGLGTVILPRISNLIQQNNQEKMATVFRTYLCAISCLSLAMAFGIAAIAPKFTPLFFGNEFIPCIVLIVLLSPALWLKAISTTVAQSYLIPTKSEKIYVVSVICGAAVNLIVNLILIPRYEAIGAVLGTVVAEAVVTIIQIIWIQKETNICDFYKEGVVLVGAGAIMFICVRLVSGALFGWFTVFLEIITGVIVYTSIVFLYCKLVPDTSISKLVTSLLKQNKK